MKTFLNRKMTRAWRNTPSWPPCPAYPAHSLSVGAPSSAGSPAQAFLPIPWISGCPPRLAPLPSLSCTPLGCRGTLSSWPPAQLASPCAPSRLKHSPSECRGALLLPRRALGLALGITLAVGVRRGCGTLEALQQVVAHGGVSSLEAVFLRAGLGVKVCLFVGVLDLCGPDDTNRDVLLPLAVGQVVHGFCLPPAGVCGGPALLQPQPHADHRGGTAQQQRKDQHHTRPNGHPGEWAGLALHVLLREVHHHGAWGRLGEQELAVGAPVASGALTQVAEGPLVAGGPIVAGCMLTPADGGTAVPARVPGGAGAGVLVHAIPAGAPVGTRGGGTVVHVVITVPPREASLAAADVRVTEVHALRTWDTDRAAAHHLGNILGHLLPLPPGCTPEQREAGQIEVSTETTRVTCQPMAGVGRGQGSGPNPQIT